MDAKHTPGPWRPSRHGPSDLIYGVEAGPLHDSVKVVTWGGIGRPSSVVGQANARLIAAAPELLETAIALRQAQRDYLADPIGSRSNEKGRLVGVAADALDTAIAKATGEA